MKIGYARVSTQEQNLERQIDLLVANGCTEKNIIFEKGTGKNIERKGLEELLLKLRKDDVVVVESISRLGRSLRDLITIVGNIHAKEAHILSLKENFIDTTTPQGKLVFQIFAVMAQFERELIAERTVHALQSAKLRGRAGGRPKVDKQKIDMALALYNTHEYSVCKVCELSGISKGSLFRYLKEVNC